MLADIASKGGNFLLNIGPTSEGVFPPESLDRLREIGRWMKVNGDAIYGTQASPFAGLEWGRCTQKSIDGGTRLYLHVFSWPKDQRLVVPGILNSVKQAYLLSRPQDLRLAVTREADALVVRLPVEAPDAVNSIVVLDVAGKPDITAAPVITSAHPIFVDSLQITLRTDRENTEVRYTLDGTLPQPSSPLAQAPFWIKKTTRVTAQCYRSGTPVSDTTSARFMLVSPIPPVRMDRAASGIRFAYYEGKWDTLPDFAALAPAAEGVLPQMAISSHRQPDYFGFEFRGFIRVPRDGVYAFSTTSDDGSRLYIGDVLVVDNNGLHGMREAAGVIPLAAGLHPIRVGYFERTGGEGLEVAVQGPGMEKTIIPGELLFHAEDGMGNK
jgi:alpha-L-fucosidase